jgi:hypothetical protein
MGKVLRFFLSLIGYACVASVITAIIGLAYLWQTDALSDEDVFRIVAIIHDVDLGGLEEEAPSSEEAVPPQEVSLEELDRQRALALRNYELKSAQLDRNLQEFDHKLNQIQELQRRFDNQAKSFRDLLAAEEAKAVQQGNAEVVSQWEQMKPAQVKDLIMTMRENGELKDVVMLLGKTGDLKKRKILAQFSTEVPEEKEALYEIQAHLRNGFPAQDVIDRVRQQELPTETGA